MELDKKTVKVQADLVQAVFEAQEKRNVERVDMLVTNAIKQLKMSRFKPDLTTCLSLAYLARVQPKIFQQSQTIKEAIKSLIRRDQGPANIKGKNDIVLPVLAANLLLATCDAPETRSLVLQKIEQWLTGGQNQKVSDLVQHLLATLCTKCHSDKATITSLIDMRQHWLQYLDDNHSFYGSVPVDLSANIRRLLQSETSCDSLVGYLKFLINYDTDTQALSMEVSKFITERPLSLKKMLQEEGCGTQLNQMMLKIFNKLFDSLKQATPPLPQVKQEKVEPTLTQETATATTTTTNPQQAAKKEEDNKFSTTTSDQLYVKLSDCTHAILLSRPTIEAVLALLSVVDMTDDWPFDKSTALFEDFALTTPYNLPDRLRQKLIQSSNELLVDFGLNHASIGQLVDLLQSFGLSNETLAKIFKRLESMKDIENIRSEVKDAPLFGQMVEFYKESGIPGAVGLQRRLELSSS